MPVFPAHFVLNHTLGSNLHAINPNLSSIRHLQKIYTPEQGALPAPLAPIRTTTSPLSTEAETPENVVISGRPFPGLLSES